MDSDGTSINFSNDFSNINLSTNPSNINVDDDDDDDDDGDIEFSPVVGDSQLRTSELTLPTSGTESVLERVSPLKNIDNSDSRRDSLASSKSGKSRVKGPGQGGSKFLNNRGALQVKINNRFF